MSALDKSIKVIYAIIFALFDSIYQLWRTYAPAKFVYANYEGKNVLITGAGSGIGQALSKLFAQKGCNLILWDVNAEGLEKTRQMCQSFQIKVVTKVVNVTDRVKVYAAADELKKLIPNGHVDVLVNNAGIVSGKTFLQTPDTEVERTLLVNSMAHFWTLKAFLPGMLERNSGHIVSIASTAGLLGIPGLVDYCGSKFAAVGIEESVRHELWNLGSAANGVHSTVVCPYVIESGMFEGFKFSSRALLPPTSVEDAAFYIMDATLRRINFLCFPFGAKLAIGLRPFLTSKSIFVLMKALGITESMSNFKGRNADHATKKD